MGATCGKSRVAKKVAPQDTHAFGKLILFGEHFVVYQVPALVAAVAAYTDCEVSFTDSPGLTVTDERPAVPGYKKEKKEEARCLPHTSYFSRNPPSFPRFTTATGPPPPRALHRHGPMVLFFSSSSQLFITSMVTRRS